MPEVHHMPTPARGSHAQPLVTGQSSMAIINLRGNAQDVAFVQAVHTALGVTLPIEACSTVCNLQVRIVWAGPDDWFVISQAGLETTLVQQLQQALQGQHCAVTDVSSGYFLVTLEGPQARDLLSQGCPMDFHPREFKGGRAVGTHFFKVGLYLWQRDETPTFEMLVRRSFIDHFWQLIQLCTQSYGWVGKQTA
jgi:sarcosine oxidase subunit gamma